MSSVEDDLPLSDTELTLEPETGTGGLRLDLARRLPLAGFWQALWVGWQRLGKNRVS